MHEQQSNFLRQPRKLSLVPINIPRKASDVSRSRTSMIGECILDTNRSGTNSNMVATYHPEVDYEASAKSMALKELLTIRSSTQAL